MATISKFVILGTDEISKDTCVTDYFKNEGYLGCFSRYILPRFVSTVAGGYIGSAFVGPPGIPIGMGLGYYVGDLTSKEIYLFEYEQWKEKNKDLIVFDELLNCFPNNNELIAIQCPISYELLTHPVITPFGDHYQNHVMQALKAQSSDGVILDPMRKGSYKYSDLSQDCDFLMHVKKVLKKYLSIAVQEEKLTDAVKEGMNILKRVEICSFERVKVLRFNDRKLVHISNIDPFTIVESQEL